MIPKEKAIKYDFMWAVEQMKQGKKVRCSDWHETRYIEKQENNDIVYNSGDHKTFIYENFVATDWEIYEEPKKTLLRYHPCNDEGHEDRGSHMCLCPDGDYLKFEDVKEFIKELLRFCNEDVLIQQSGKHIIETVMSKIQKDAGKELVEKVNTGGKDGRNHNK